MFLVTALQKRMSSAESKIATLTTLTDNLQGSLTTTCGGLDLYYSTITSPRDCCVTATTLQLFCLLRSTNSATGMTEGTAGACTSCPTGLTG